MWNYVQCMHSEIKIFTKFVKVPSISIQYWQQGWHMKQLIFTKLLSSSFLKLWCHNLSFLERIATVPSPIQVYITKLVLWNHYCMHNRNELLFKSLQYYRVPGCLMGNVINYPVPVYCTRANTRNYCTSRNMHTVFAAQSMMYFHAQMLELNSKTSTVQ